MEKFGHDANSCPLGSEYKSEGQINSNGGNVVQVCRKETSQHPGQLKKILREHQWSLCVPIYDKVFHYHSSGMPGPLISQLGTTRDVFVILLLTAAAVKELT